MIPKIKIRGNCKLEKDFQAQLWKAYNSEWHYAYKIPDSTYSTKPYDWYVIDKDTGITYHVESKIIDWYSINIKELRPNQRASLDKISKINKDIALVWVFSKKINDYIIINYTDFIASSNEEWTVKLFDKG